MSEYHYHCQSQLLFSQGRATWLAGNHLVAARGISRNASHGECKGVRDGLCYLALRSAKEDQLRRGPFFSMEDDMWCED
jgi:hypothetical protein